jgi:hypothetical protein
VGDTQPSDEAYFAALTNKVPLTSIRYVRGSRYRPIEVALNFDKEVTKEITTIRVSLSTLSRSYCHMTRCLVQVQAYANGFSRKVQVLVGQSGLEQVLVQLQAGLSRGQHSLGHFIRSMHCIIQP